MTFWAFIYLVGNADLHLKNFSLHAPRPGAGLVPAPAYDLVSTVMYPTLNIHMALQMQGKGNGFRTSDFTTFFGRYDLNEEVVKKTLARIAQAVARRYDDLRDVAPETKVGGALIEVLKGRADRL